MDSLAKSVMLEKIRACHIDEMHQLKHHNEKIWLHQFFAVEVCQKLMRPLFSKRAIKMEILIVMTKKPFLDNMTKTYFQAKCVFIKWF